MRVRRAQGLGWHLHGRAMSQPDGGDWLREVDRERSTEDRAASLEDLHGQLLRGTWQQQQSQRRGRSLELGGDRSEEKDRPLRPLGGELQTSQVLGPGALGRQPGEQAAEAAASQGLLDRPQTIDGIGRLNDQDPVGIDGMTVDRNTAGFMKDFYGIDSGLVNISKAVQFSMSSGTSWS